MNDGPPILPVALSSLRAAAPHVSRYQESVPTTSRRHQMAPGQVHTSHSFAAQLGRERTIWRGHGSPYLLLTSGWPTLLGFVILQALALAGPQLGELALPMLDISGFVLLSFVAWWVPVRAWPWAVLHYSVTDTRVVTSLGVLRCRREETEIRNIATVRVDQHSPLQTALGIGDVRLRTAFGSLVLANISHPHEIADLIMAEVERQATRSAVMARLGTPPPQARAVFGAHSRFSTMPALSSTHRTAPVELRNRGSPTAFGATRDAFGGHGGNHTLPTRAARELVEHASWSGQERVATLGTLRGLSAPPSTLLAEVPSVIGLALLDATVVAQAAGLNLIVVGERAVPHCDAGRVLEQVPYPGTCVLTAPELRVMLTAGVVGQTGHAS